MKESCNWKSVAIETAILTSLSIGSLFISHKFAVFFLLVLLGVWSRIPGHLTNNHLAGLELNDFFGIVLAISYGPIWGFASCIISYFLTRPNAPKEYPTVFFKLGLARAIGAVVAYYLYTNVISNLGLVITIVIVLNELIYVLVLTPIIEGKEAIGIELYYTIVNIPTVYLDRLLMNFIGGQYLLNMAVGNASIIPLYIIAGVAAFFILFSRPLFAKIKLHREKLSARLNAAEGTKKVTRFLHRLGFEAQEAKAMLIASFLLSVLLAFVMIKQFSLEPYLLQLAITFPIVLVCYAAHHRAHKWAAFKLGLYAEHKLYMPILGLLFFSGILTGAFIPVAGEPILKPLRFLRLGKRYDEQHPGPKDRMWVYVAGIMTTTGLMIFSKAMEVVFGKSIIFDIMFIFNFWFAVVNILPITIPQKKGLEWLYKNFMPSFDGAHILFGSPRIFAVIIGFVLVSAITLMFLPISLVIVLALCIGFIAGLFAVQICLPEKFPDVK